MILCCFETDVNRCCQTDCRHLSPMQLVVKPCWTYLQETLRWRTASTVVIFVLTSVRILSFVSRSASALCCVVFSVKLGCSELHEATLRYDVFCFSYIFSDP